MLSSLPPLPPQQLFTVLLALHIIIIIISGYWLAVNISSLVGNGVYDSFLKQYGGDYSSACCDKASETTFHTLCVWNSIICLESKSFSTLSFCVKGHLLSYSLTCRPGFSHPHTGNIYDVRQATRSIAPSPSVPAYRQPA